MTADDILKAAIALTFFASPVLAALPIFFAPQSKDANSAIVWLAVCFYAVILSSLNLRIQLSEIDALNAAFRWVVGPFASVVFLALLFLASIRLPDLKPSWIRLVAAISFLPLVALGFAGIADLVDGSEGPFGMVQYGFEFYIRALDMLSFGFLSSYDAGGYSEFVVLTRDRSPTVLVFNFVVGSILISTLIRLIFGRTHSRTKRAE